MSEFVMTRAAQAKKSCQENFVTVTYTAPKKKNSINNTESIKSTLGDKLGKFNSNSGKIDQNREHELEMKRLRWDVMKFGSSGFKGVAKHKAKVALAIELGAQPPKNRRQNYKKLLLRKSKLKKAAAENEKNKSGLSESLKKPMKDKKTRKESGLLNLYGKVQKNRKK
ncbi:hypothetical protein PV325_004276 [Microctonus aethiopoides]|uniref:Uncharacterized protein n=1 Tax=Microctonus aethiopoides TaxID=144406 RepID=A0AA39KSK6_9HYME|nr:hypothetical protein PV325_004276 [Microctonus aethiopoides]KAK0098655.1 hypothetical protein PV326_005351 [Microctonus aethiopoides]KAK0172255.1 hypothetical protein PV328_005599 [Microctonus aethiopoides]